MFDWGIVQLLYESLLLNHVPITLPPLRERQEDIYLLFRKFAADFGEKYRMPGIRLSEDAVTTLNSYRWPSNIRQLKNITEQISVIEKERLVDSPTLIKYLPSAGSGSTLPMVINNQSGKGSSDFSERDLLYKVLFDMKKDINEVKQTIVHLMKNESSLSHNEKTAIITKLNKEMDNNELPSQDISYDNIDISSKKNETENFEYPEAIQENVVIEESLSLEEREKELIIKALNKHNGRRKNAALELGISERTLYRKIKEYDIQK